MAKDMRIALLLDYYGNLLTKKQFEVIDLYYNEDLSLFEISEHANITRQGVRDSIKRAEAILLDTENKLGFVSRIERLMSLRERAYELTMELFELDAKRIFSPELKEGLTELEKLLSPEDDVADEGQESLF